IDSATRQKLEGLIRLRDQLNGIDAKMDALEQEEGSIADDQERIRENITALSKTAEAKQLIARYIAKADTQESRIEEIARERKRLETERADLRTKLVTEVRLFEFEQKN
ncbi:MAG: hypothetical protein OEM82_04875, partial [Acidobacteriota bacterium]|nr:hypothetical protein [Acidobacteriota bacterium]